MESVEFKEQGSISQDGEAFLKTATAAPDFENLDFEGIPDGHSGPTVCVKQYFTETITANAGETLWLIMTPQCEVAHWHTSVVGDGDWINGQIINPTLFPDTDGLFPSAATSPSDPEDWGGGNTTFLSQYRMVSSAAEISCLNNAFNQYGSVTVFKTPLSAQLAAARADTGPQPVLRSINGIDALVKQVVGSQAFVRPVRDGAYSVSMNREDEFQWGPILDVENLSSVHNAYAAFGPTASPGVRYRFNGPMATWDNNFDTIVFKITVPPAVVNQSFILSRWVTFEAQPIFNSFLWNMSHMSPDKDAIALAFYRELARNLPVAVPYRQNPDFWNTVLEIIEETSNVLSFVPGPVGQIASGVHAVSSVLRKPPRRRRKKGKSKKIKPKRRQKGGRRN